MNARTACYCAALLIYALCRAEEDAPPSPPQIDPPEKILSELGSDDWQIRGNARRQLSLWVDRDGEQCEALLRPLQTNADADVREPVRAALGAIEGMHADQRAFKWFDDLK